ncbi:MAG: hypothetical protein COB33_011485 [Thiotrichaceae bacterium]|nr:hypothetical protein [Thiotrichaceae bacterium]PCI14299.1 MAG: hypothetical protein COB71_02940 [Thiotrichales bacterium]
MTNKATQTREALNLTSRQAGELFTGHLGQNAYDTWSRWERTGNWPEPVNQMLKITLTLIMARDLKTKGASGALDLVIKMLQGDKNTCK